MTASEERKGAIVSLLRGHPRMPTSVVARYMCVAVSTVLKDLRQLRRDELVYSESSNSVWEYQLRWSCRNTAGNKEAE